LPRFAADGGELHYETYGSGPWIDALAGFHAITLDLPARGESDRFGDALPMPALVILAGADEYMRPADELLAQLRPSAVVHLPDCGHHQVMPNGDVKRAVAEFLADLRG